MKISPSLCLIIGAKISNFHDIPIAFYERMQNFNTFVKENVKIKDFSPLSTKQGYTYSIYTTKPPVLRREWAVFLAIAFNLAILT